MSRYVPSETQRQFMQADAYVRVLAGPVGGGKSVTCVHELLRLACEQAPNRDNVRKTRALIVRNTADQLAQTTRRTVFDWLPPGEAGLWHSTLKTYTIRARLPDGTTVETEWLFIALDSPDDVRKALSLEATFLWGNEARELHADVVDGLLGRINRYPSMKDGGATRACAIFDTNMPDDDTWWQKKMEEPPANWSIHIQPAAVLTALEYTTIHHEEPDPLLGIQGNNETFWVNPACDNYKNLAANYYPNLVPGKTDDWINVYLRSRYGRSLSGTPVYEKTFVENFHVARDRLLPTRGEGYPIVIGLDFGRTPAAVFMQRDARGRVLVLSEVTSENMGIETFLTTRLQPHIAAKYQGCSFVVAPDPAGFARTQLNEMTLVDAVTKAGFRCVRPPSNNPELRIQAVERLLNQQLAGEAMFLIDPEDCPELVRGFRYGYRYKLKKNGEQEDRPDKNASSHIHDALQYGASVVDMNIRGKMLVVRRREVKKVAYLY